MRKRVRQECPLNPLFFAFVIADVEGEMKKGQVDGELIGKDRIWTLAYANNLILLERMKHKTNIEGWKDT